MQNFPCLSRYPTWPCRRHRALQPVPHLAEQTPPRLQHLSYLGLHMPLLQQQASHPLSPRGPGLTWSPQHSAARSPRCWPPPRRSCRSARPPCLRSEPRLEPRAAARRPEHTRNAEPPAASRLEPASPAACSRPPPLVAAGRRPSPASPQGPLASMAAATTVWRTGRGEGQKTAAVALDAYGIGVGVTSEREELLAMGGARRRSFLQLMPFLGFASCCSPAHRFPGERKLRSCSD